MRLIKKSVFNLSLPCILVFLTIPSFAQSPLYSQFEQIARNLKGNVGVCAMILETGETISFNGDKHFPMQSVYKFPIAMAVLDKVDNGKIQLKATIRVEKSEFIPQRGHSPLREKFSDGLDITVLELIMYAVAESDGSASDVLLRILGGTKNADKYIHDLGVKDISIATTEMVQVVNDSIQYQNWTTPVAMTRLLNIFFSTNRLSEKSKALLLKIMIESTPGPKRIKGHLPPETIVAHKTGTSGNFQGIGGVVNDVGIIMLPNGKHLAVAVFISDSQDSYSNCELTIAKLSRAAFDFSISK